MKVAQLYQTIFGHSNRNSNPNREKLSILCSVINGNGNKIYESLPSFNYTILPQAAYLTLYGMQ
ncbi:hypothetical protein [Candidatus Hartigia pinicola]